VFHFPFKQRIVIAVSSALLLIAILSTGAFATPKHSNHVPSKTNKAGHSHTSKPTGKQGDPGCFPWQAPSSGSGSFLEATWIADTAFVEAYQTDTLSNGSQAVHVWRSTNGGQSWTDLGDSSPGSFDYDNYIFSDTAGSVWININYGEWSVATV